MNWRLSNRGVENASYDQTRRTREKEKRHAGRTAEVNRDMSRLQGRKVTELASDQTRGSSSPLQGRRGKGK
jgi:hypothetical protein